MSLGLSRILPLVFMRFLPLPDSGQAVQSWTMDRKTSITITGSIIIRTDQR